jgi:hypothetical protein
MLIKELRALGLHRRAFLAGLTAAGAGEAIAAKANDEVLIVADEMPAMQRLAMILEARAGVHCTLVEQTAIPADTSRFAVLIVYIHLKMIEPAEQAFIAYAEAGGKLILLHHSISSGKRDNKYWFPFLGVALPKGELAEGGYQYFDPVEMDMVNVAPGHYITSRQVQYPVTTMYKSKGDAEERLLPAIPMAETEVYLNHVLTGERTILLGVKYRDAKSGQLYMQNHAGWIRPAGKGSVMYFMAGHSLREFDNQPYAQILINAVKYGR